MKTADLDFGLWILGTLFFLLFTMDLGIALNNTQAKIHTFAYDPHKTKVMILRCLIQGALKKWKPTINVNFDGQNKLPFLIITIRGDSF